MPETDARREVLIREAQADGVAGGCWCELCTLLRLLDAEREKVEKACAAAVFLGQSGVGVLNALRGDPAAAVDYTAVRDAVGEEEPQERETVDLVTALRESVEAAKRRREAQGS